MSQDASWHTRCVVCGERNSIGLKMSFVRLEDGSVEGEFRCGELLEGYPNQLHGGVIALLLDGATTNCLYVHGKEAVTAELTVRYRHPVVVNRTATVRAWIERAQPRLCHVAAELVQDGRLKAAASAKFMNRERSAVS